MTLTKSFKVTEGTHLEFRSEVFNTLWRHFHENGNGCTWVAPQSFAVSLDDTCFVAKEGEDPVKITRIAAHDAWNVTQVSWDNRLNQYASEITGE